MSGTGDGDFEVTPKELKKAGESAGEISERMLRHDDDMLSSAKPVSSGLAGFALTGALTKCAQAWESELDSLGHGIRDSSEKLHNNAANYEKSDQAGSTRFGTIGGAMGSPGS